MKTYVGLIRSASLMYVFMEKKKKKNINTFLLK